MSIMFSKTILYFAFFFLTLVPYFSNAQVDYLIGHDIKKGEELYKANCTSCHKLGDEKKARLIGPGLNPEIFEEYTEEWLISWIKNSSALIESGDEQAIAIFEEYNQSVMTAFPTFSDDDVRDILAYIENPPVEEVSIVEVLDVEDVQKESINTQSLLLIALVLFSILGFLVFIKNSLKKASKIEETIFQGFKKWVLSNLVIVIIIAHLGVLCLIVLGWQSLSKIGISQNYQPAQPIEFSHKVHAGQQGIDCNYCHSSARKSKHSGIPSANVCMNCHANIVEGPKHGTKEIAKIYKAVGYDVDTRSYIEGYEEQPIKWVRIHNLPDLAYFNHSQHVVAGGLECQECHGAIEEMDEVYQKEKLTMGWCINCHRDSKIDLDNPYYHGYNDWIEKHKKADLTVENIGGLECGKCHY
ncbi:MAG: cytochrome C [Flavobacteriales bacterium]|nr:cytochrome C [Flavobacteriales bacterium]